MAIRHQFLERLDRGPVLCDGAMGTMLYSRGIHISRCFDELNLSHPDLVGSIHRDYIRAGVDIIETNTYGANRVKLLPHALEDRVVEINRAGAELARECVLASESPVWVGGSVGPIGKPLKISRTISSDESEDIFIEQIKALVYGGVDLLILETFSHLEELKLAIRVARHLTDIPIVAQMSFLENGMTIEGDRPEEIPAPLSEAGADVVGVNCSFGPKLMLETLQQMASKSQGIYLAAQPNAGNPELVEGRWIYVSSPEYMAEYARRLVQSAGVRFIGGCCGTTPEHIRAMSGMLKSMSPHSGSVSYTGVIEEDDTEPMQPVPLPQRSKFARDLAVGRFCASVEMNPPRTLTIEKFLDGARLLKEAGVDVINIPDGPRATARISPLAMAILVQNRIDLEVFLHYSCRDRNLLGMQSDLLGAHILGIRNLLIVTGDPPKLGDYPNATAVFDVDSIGLTAMVHRMNCGLNLVGRTLEKTTSFLAAVGVNPGAINLDEEIRRFREKVQAGAECVFTQPVFDLENLQEFLIRTEDIPIPVIAGILPLTSFRNAEFFHNEVPGMNIPEAVRERMRRVGSGKKARAEGITIAKAALLECRGNPRIRGVYIMPPLGYYEMALEVLGPILEERRSS
ncbi:MAG: bifunctional homocysteine S-methyltransferase/methylenetetrahydrofolate reductase [Candidatus Eisenbacteria bacterium]|uniref:Bifunctional homocysteine S-methyltransferase/methylenetetrahydrofolate reductase n=1 Tax=Eiseniibacteriota bacterium TaxID=2212470 RepID=A0A948WC21_UNCEI|nr:bifunctional homocysteine S-methyltransferase/methylenetetrahydrofolate reductase [Candidatus Eisenbacteria bacterium]MBU1947330.1 bifunctional homocysteine S-methyltransferase/methylenetetrahydrofolate reductase [Candidatus Eisenbacteria bacterium]MBU2690518.1 bifunctional homocysteine S-methyltransferase/methylenetetrahydrofolate reductase [Candidatus Eisenbacteria bacterium]